MPDPTKEGTSSSDGGNLLARDILAGRIKGSQLSAADKKKCAQSAILHEFMVMLSVCHTVIPEKINDAIIYHAASPGISFFFFYST